MARSARMNARYARDSYTQDSQILVGSTARTGIIVFARLGNHKDTAIRTQKRSLPGSNACFLAWHERSMNPFDATIIHFFNLFAQRSELFDRSMWFMTHNVFAVGAVPMAFFWYAWIRYGTTDPVKRQILLFGIFDSVFALFIARVLALSLPFRLRPFHNPALHFQVPFGVEPGTLIGWSSFPSDRATLFFCVAVVLWLVSRHLGRLAIGYTFVGLCIPAMYAGIHYPTDILAGALLGSGIALLCKSTGITARVAPPMIRWLETRPALSHAVLFLLTFEIAELFGSVRTIILQALHFAKLIV